MLQCLSLLILSLLCISCPASGCLPSSSCSCSNTQATCCFRVQENTPLGTVLGSASEINDQNLENLFSPVTFTVQSGNKINVSSNGTITVSAPLDREDSSCFNVILTAQGVGSSYTPNVAVELLDENDNSPVFSGVSSGVFNISKQETDAPTTDFFCSHSLLANDPDEGPNGTIANYTVLSPPSTFSVWFDSNRVCLNSLKALNRETNATITIILLAVDNGTVIQRNGSIKIILTLLDTNDNNPVFINTPLNDTLTVPETSPINTTIFNYIATDADDGSNARIFFHLQSSSQVPFAIRNDGTLYVNGELDADVSDCTNPVTYTFDIIITNTDNVNDAMRSISPLTITIDSVVENPPDMSFTSYGIDFVEGFTNSSRSSQTYRVQNKECNTNYTAQITAGSQYFQIVGLSPIPGFDVSGFFFLQAKAVTLDREETPVIEVLMVFTANGDPEPLSTTVPFNVTLLDINDNPPSLSRTTFSIEENVRLGYLIDSLPPYFEDPDNGDNGTYGGVTQLTGDQLIRVRDADIAGAIRVYGSLDYESLGNEIIVNITLYDKGTPRLSSNITLIINLIDVNDNAPVFMGISNGTVFNISENKPSGSHITIIQATDRDSGLNSNLTYSLLNSTLFVIDPLTGQLDSALSFDREETSEYVIDILVTDGGTPPLSSSVSVKIKINDLNDNPPSFENETYQFYTSTDRSVGAIVGVVQAIDPDSGENAVVRYRLTNHVPITYFEINSKGEISISESLPQDDGQIFNITVEAYNPSNRSMNSTAEVQIIINFNPSATPTTSSNSGSILMYIAYGAPALFIALVFAIITTACLICCIRCYKHRSRDLYKFDEPLPVSQPKKSSLRAVPTAGSRYEDSSAFYRKTSAASANGAPPKSPTVNFSDKSEVHYYSTEETMLSDATDGIGRIGLNPPPAVIEEIELSEPPVSPDHCTPTKATPPGEAETSLTARGVISSSTSTVVGPNSLSDDLSLSPGSINTTQELSHIYNKHSKGPPVLREDLLKKHDREYAGSSFPQAIVDEGSLSDGESTSDMVNHAPSRNMPRPPYHLMGGANGSLRYPPPLSSEEPVLTTGMSSEFISHPVKPSHSLPPPPPHSLPHSLPHPSRTHSNSVMYYPHGGSHAHNRHPSRNMYENTYPYKTHQPNHMNGSLLRSSSSTSSSSHNTSDFVPPPGFYRYPSREYRDMPPPTHNGHSAEYHSNHGHSARTHMSHSPASSSAIRDHSYPPHHVHPLIQDKYRYQQPVAPYVDGYSTDEDGTVASSILDEYLQFEPPPLKHDFLSLSVDDIKLSSTDPDLKHGGGGGGGGGNRRNES